MEIIEIRTLFDITNTQVMRLTQGSQLEMDQCRNFITLKQCIELRSIVEYDRDPEVEKIDIKGLGFGSAYKGKNLVWTFRFTPDREDVYKDDSDNVLGLLINDLHGVPIIKNLTESINIDKAVFNVLDNTYKNTTVRLFSGKP